jgi:hypothetical protein
MKLLWMHPEYLQVALQEILSDLDPADLTLSRLLEQVSVKRERELFLWELPLPTPMFGAVMAGPNTDYIVYEQNTPQFHRDHIVLHEIGHLVLGHPVLTVTEDLKPGTDLRQLLLSAAMRVSRFELPEEQEAEAFATLVQRLVMDRSGLRALSSQVATAPGWARLVSGLSLD